jgi:integrase
MSVRVRNVGNGRWQVDVIYRRPDGRRARDRRRVRVSSKSAAHRWGEARERHLLFYGPTPSSDEKEVPTLAQFAPRFLDGYARANRQKPSGVAQKEIALRVHLVPLLGTTRLAAITNEDVQQLKQRMTGKSVKTVNNVLTVLSKLLKVAVEWTVIPAMPCTVRLLKTGEGSIHFWDFDEYERLVEAAGTIDRRVLVVVLLGGEAGLRAGEMRALEWADVDLVKRQLRIERSEWRGEITPTKGNRVRYVQLTNRLAKALQQHRHLQGKRVLCEIDGQPLTANALAYLVERATRAAGLASGRKPKGAGPHVLRHTFCSRLAMRGAPAKAIQELAGHRDLATTQRYMHLSPTARESAIRLLDTPHVATSVATSDPEMANASS